MIERLRRAPAVPEGSLALIGAGRSFFLAGLLSGFFAAAMTVVVALLVADVIASVFVGGATLEAVTPALVGAVALALLRAALLTLQEMFSQRASSRLRATLRADLATRLLERGPAWLSGQRTGEVVSSVTGGLEAIDTWITSYRPARALAGLVPAFVLVVVLLIDAPTALVLILTGPVLVLLLAVIGGRARVLTRRRFDEMRWMSAFFLDMLQGVSTLKAFGRSREQVDNIRHISEQYGATTMDVLRTAFQTALVLEWATAVATAVVAVEVSLRLMAGAMAFEAAIAVLIITPEFFSPLRQLALRYHAGSAGRAAAERITAILTDGSDGPTHAIAGGNVARERDSGQDPGDAVTTTVPDGPHDIRFEGVWFSYPGRSPVLRALDLHVPAGRTVALVGSSGAGKTTAAALLLKFIEPDRGRVLIDDIALASLDRARWLSRVAWVPQRPYLTFGSVAEVIRLARPAASDAEVIAAARAAHADDFIRALPSGYETQLGERAARLSGGQQQRLAIARAFLRSASLVVLDEPTSHLDAESEAAMGDALGRLAQGRTVLVISHRLRLAALADEVIELEDGVVVRSGSPSLLLEPTGAGHPDRTLDGPTDAVTDGELL